MTRDIETLTEIIKWCVFICATTTTAFPVLYAFAPWYTTNLGRLLMFMTLSFAIVLDVTVLFMFWHPKDILWYFWIQLACFLLIAMSTTGLTIAMVRWNYKRWRRNHGTVSQQHTVQQAQVDHSDPSTGTGDALRGGSSPSGPSGRH